MKVVIIAAFAHLGWDKEDCDQSKYAFWKCAISREGRRMNIVDYYRNGQAGQTVRHIYNIGIVLFNYFHQHGCETHLINCLEDLSSEDIEQVSMADVVVISTVYAGYGDVLKNITDVVSLVRSRNPRGKIVVGGWSVYHLKKKYPDGQFQDTINRLTKAGVDVLVISKQGLNSLWRKLNEGFTGVIMDDDYELPGPEMYSVKNLPKPYHAAHTAIVTATGCPFDCHFCEYKKLYHRVTYYSLVEVKRLLAGISEGRRVALKHVRFGDECLNYPYGRLMEICRFLSRANFGFSWGGFLKLGNIDEHLAREMKKSNCSFASIGMESGDVRMRKTMNKMYTDDELEKSITVLKKYGIKTIVSLVVGYYGENEETIKATQRVLERVMPDLARINIWQPYYLEDQSAPGRKHHLSIREGFWKHDSMDLAAANVWASYLYRETKNVVFTPPFTSIFDIWPWFVGEGLDENQIVDLIGKYHRESRDALSK